MNSILKGVTDMKKLIALVLALVCVIAMVGCNQSDELRQGDNNMQYFFTAKVVEVDEEYLLLEVFDTGNSNLSEGAKVEVSTEVVAAKGCPEFVVDECARVLMARNTDDNPPGRLEALSIYKTDETGSPIAETITFRDKTFNKADLSQETMEWLEKYNALSATEQLEISSIPADLYELCGYGNAEDVSAVTD